MKKIIKFELFLIFLVFIFILLFILYINIIVYKYLMSAKDDLLNDFKQNTGFSIKYKNIYPNIIGKIKIKEVLLSREDSIVELGDIEISYSFLPFFNKNKNLLSFIKKIKLESFNMKINKENNFSDLQNLLNKFKNKKSNKKMIIDDLIIEIPNGQIMIYDKKLSYIIRSNILKINIKKNTKVNSILEMSITNKNEENIFYSKIKINGIINKINNVSNSDFNIDILKADLLSNHLKPQKFIFNSNGKEFNFKRLNDSLPINISLKKNEDSIIFNSFIDNLDLKTIFIADKKTSIIPDKLTFNSNFIYNLKSQKKDGKLEFFTHYNNLVFLNNFGIDILINFKESIAYIDRFFIYNITKNNNINLTGNIPLDFSDYNLLLSFNNFILPKAVINNKISIEKNKNNINVIGNNFLLNGFNLGSFHYQIIKNDNKYKIITNKRFNGYDLSGEINKSNDNYSINLTHDFINFSISKIINALKKETGDDNYLLNGTLNSFTSKEYSEIKKSNFKITKNNSILTNFEINLQNELFNLSNLKLFFNNNLVNINAWINYKKQPIVANINIENNKNKHNIITKISSNNINIIVDNTLNIFLNQKEKNIHFIADNFKIPFNNKVSTFNFDFIYDLKTKSIDNNIIEINNINIFKNQIGKATVNLSLNNGFLIFDDFKYQDNINRLTGKIINEIRKTNNLIIKGNGFLKDDLNKESYSINYETLNDTINAKLYITQMNINKLINNNKIKGFINLRLKAEGNILNPLINIDFDISEGKYSDKNLFAYCILKKENQILNIKNANIQVEQNKLSIKNSQVIFNKDKSKNLDINGTVYMEGLGKILKTSFVAMGYTGTKTGTSEYDINFEIFNTTIGYIKSSELNNVEKFSPIQFNVSKKNNIVKIKNYGDRIFDISINENNINIDLFNENQQVLDGKIKITNKNYNGKLKFTKFPVNVVQRVLLPFVSIDYGLVDGNIDLKGKVNNPEFYGILKLYYGKITLEDYLREPITNITGTIILEKEKLLVRNVNANVKDGMVHGFGELLLNGWKLERYMFQINSGNVPGIIKAGPVDATANGYVNSFIFEGRPKSYNFIGDIVVSEADINLESLMGIGKKRKFKNKKFPINLYVKFRSGNKVKINYPIIKGILNPDQTFILKYIGDETAIYLGGNISLKKGVVNYLNREFKIEHANFQFFDDETKINPNVNLRAYYRTKGLSRDSLVIYMNINNRLVPFKTTFSSFPYRTQEELQGLLGLSYASTTTENDNDINYYSKNTINSTNIETLLNTTNYISNALLLTPIENKIRKITNLDTFNLNTEIFGNILKSSDNENTLDILDDTSITFGKYIFDELYFESMFTFNKRDYVDDKFLFPLRDQNYGFNLQLMLQLELSNFLIGYTYKPKSFNDLLNADHQVSLEFDYKF